MKLNIWRMAPNYLNMTNVTMTSNTYKDVWLIKTQPQTTKNDFFSINHTPHKAIKFVYI